MYNKWRSVGRSSRPIYTAWRYDSVGTWPQNTLNLPYNVARWVQLGFARLKIEIRGRNHFRRVFGYIGVAKRIPQSDNPHTKLQLVFVSRCRNFISFSMCVMPLHSLKSFATGSNRDSVLLPGRDARVAYFCENQYLFG